LPGMDGYEVARRLRQQPRLQRLALVALTGYGREEDRHRAREAGFDQHLTKPIDPSVLEDILLALASGAAPTAPEPTVH
jgi:CheY-like chemotaxis protein